MKDSMQLLFPCSFICRYVYPVDMDLDQFEGAESAHVAAMCQPLLNEISSFLPCCCYSPVVHVFGLRHPGDSSASVYFITAFSDVKENRYLRAEQKNNIFSDVRQLNLQGGQFTPPVVQIRKETFST